MNEIWKDIKGFEGLYQVSNYGRVKSLARRVPHIKRTRLLSERILKHQLREDGYLQLNLSTKGKVIKPLIHRLVAEAFIPNPNNLPQVNHKDENKTNNNVDNLEWCTQQYNSTYGTVIERLQVGNMKNRKPVLQYSLNGEFITEYESIKAVAIAVNGSGSNIRNCCTGKKKTAYGYVFKFKEAN